MTILAERDLEAEKPVVLEERSHCHVGEPEVVPRDGRVGLVDATGVEQPSAAGAGDGCAMVVTNVGGCKSRPSRSLLAR